MPEFEVRVMWLEQHSGTIIIEAESPEELDNIVYCGSIINEVRKQLNGESFDVGNDATHDEDSSLEVIFPPTVELIDGQWQIKQEDREVKE
jgi:hypothetical protein